MKKILLAGVCLFISCIGAVAQNKTLGVGVPTPNPNAALHVESPTGNQGFMMPRLTTVQREAMTSLLTDADKGLILYDSDLYSIFVWDGASWGSTSQFIVDDPASNLNAIMVSSSGVGAAGRFTINNPSTFAHAIHAENNGDSTSAAIHGSHLGNGFGVFGKSAGSKFASAAVYGEHVGTGDAAGAFRISNTSNTFSALYGETNGSGPAIYGNQKGTGRGGQFQITNNLNANASLRSYTNGTGNSGFFTVDNVSSTAAGIHSTNNGAGAAILAESTGTGSAGKFVVNNVNSGNPAIWAESNSNKPLSAPIYGLNTGTGDPAAVFRINNAVSTLPAMLAETNGTGRAATFRRTNTTGSQPAVFVDSQGGHGIWADHNGATGYAAIIQTINTSNTNAGMLVESIGTGPSVWALKSTDAASGDAFKAENMIATGSAATFSITNATNTYAAVASRTSGSGPAILAENTGAANGFAGSFTVTNTANTYPAIQASTAGTGSGVRVIQNAGPGAGMDVYMQNATSSSPGMSVDQGGLGDGGNFKISNADNNAAALSATTAAPNGMAIRASNDANGVAFAIWSGGLKIAVVDVTTSPIDKRASAYRITAGTTFTLGYIPTEGEVFMMYNESGQTVSFNASGITHTLLDGEGKTFIVFPGGAVRGF